MSTLKQIYSLTGETAQAQMAALNQAAFDLISASGVVPGAVAFHQYALKHWPKGVGPKPSAEMLALPYIIDPVRRGGRESMQFSMGLRAEGVTVAEYEAVWFADGKRPGGAAHNNISKYTDQVRNGVAGVGWFARVESAGAGHSKRFHYVITDRGMAHLAKRLAALGGTVAVVTPLKPVKVKAKANKKAAPAEAPADVPQVDTSLPATPEALADLAAHFNS